MASTRCLGRCRLPHPCTCQVLGTFITEWEQGAVYCDCMFGSEEAAEHSAAQLAAVCQTYGFDGWVINIENKLRPDHVPNMLHFLRWAGQSVLRYSLHREFPLCTWARCKACLQAVAVKAVEMRFAPGPGQATCTAPKHGCGNWCLEVGLILGGDLTGREALSRHL